MRVEPRSSRFPSVKGQHRHSAAVVTDAPSTDQEPGVQEPSQHPVSVFWRYWTATTTSQVGSAFIAVTLPALCLLHGDPLGHREDLSATGEPVEDSRPGDGDRALRVVERDPGGRGARRVGGRRRQLGNRPVAARSGEGALAARRDGQSIATSPRGDRVRLAVQPTPRCAARAGQAGRPAGGLRSRRPPRPSRSGRACWARRRTAPGPGRRADRSPYP